MAAAFLCHFPPPPPSVSSGRKLRFFPSFDRSRLFIARKIRVLLFYKTPVGPPQLLGDVRLMVSREKKNLGSSRSDKISFWPLCLFFFPNKKKPVHSSSAVRPSVQSERDIKSVIAAAAPGIKCLPAPNNSRLVR